jgi:hypothetical protein
VILLRILGWGLALYGILGLIWGGDLDWSGERIGIAYLLGLVGWGMLVW